MNQGTVATRKLYSVRMKPQSVAVSFQTARGAYAVPIAVVVSLAYCVLQYAIHHRWNEYVISSMTGGCISMVAITCFAVAPHLTHWVIDVSEELVTLQRTFQQLPIGRKRLHTRDAVTDLGLYPNDPRQGEQTGTICLWIDGRSFELERHFPATQGLALAQDLKRCGVTFLRTRQAYDPFDLLFDRSEDYLTFDVDADGA